MRLRSRLQTIHAYCGGISLLGAAMLAALLWSPLPIEIGHAPAVFWLFAVFVTLGELFPVRIPFRDGENSVTVSTAFAFAVLLGFGTVPAVIVYAVASAIGDLIQRRTWWKVLFS